MPDLNALLNPTSIAIIGASPDPGIIRGRIVAGIAHLPYPGRVYAVSRSHRQVAGLPTVARVEDLPAGLDLAIIVVPARFVAGALEAAGRHGMRAAVILSSGFAEERGADGEARQAAVVDVARRHDMAVCGPNAEGFLNRFLPLGASFSPAVFELDPTTPPAAPPGGAVAVVSQSGGIGFSFLNRGAPAGLPFSYVVSTGNEAALDSLAIVAALLDDARTGVVLMFLEGLRHPDRLAPVLRKAAALGKPLVVAKMGRSSAGAQAAASHTASLAGTYRAYRAVLRRGGAQLGVDQDQAIGVAQALLRYRDRPPQGKRVGILTPSGGAGIWLADVCADHGLEVPPLDAATRARFDALLPAYGASANPVDVTAQFVFKHGYARALSIMADSPAVDSLLVACSLVHPESIERDIENLRAVGEQLAKPVLFCAYTRAHPRAVALLSEAGFPVYTSMPGAAQAVSGLADYGAWRRRRAAAPPDPQPPPGLVRADCPGRGAARSEYETRAWLAASGIDMPEVRLAASPEAACAAAAELGFPVALKVQSEALAHKSEAGAVVLDLHDEAAVREAFHTARSAVAQQAQSSGRPIPFRGVQLQRMAAPGVEMILGINRDADFGPMLLVGSGGTAVEILGDTELLALPVARDEARTALERLRIWPILQGFRGMPTVDVAALVELMVALGHFAELHRDTLAELDLNPVRVHREGLTILDAVARVDG